MFEDVKIKHEDDCIFSHSADNMLEKFIDVGICISFRRKLRKLTLATKNHPLSKIYLRSSNVLRIEQYRNILHYSGIIHPFSTIK